MCDIVSSVMEEQTPSCIQRHAPLWQDWQRGGNANIKASTACSSVLGSQHLGASAVTPLWHTHHHTVLAEFLLQLLHSFLHLLLCKTAGTQCSVPVSM